MKMDEVRGYKVFGPDWRCRDMQYSCPGEFEISGELKFCLNGIHFCERLADCFDYYSFDPKNKVAEVVAVGRVVREDNKSCTDKLRVVRELTWEEVLRLCNTGHWNTGGCNTGDWNAGGYNTGDWNTGNCNTGNWNTGGWNAGNRNTGHWNTGNCNTGNWNTGNCNTGNHNAGNCNTGNWNTGNCNTGNHNAGSCNTGSWNTGAFNTDEPRMRLFNRESVWTCEDFYHSQAYFVLCRMPFSSLVWEEFDDMDDDERAEHPEAAVTGGMPVMREPEVSPQEWWDGLSVEDKQAVLDLPNFDGAIFREITGIEVRQ